jgi:hypothetical protein
VKSTTGCYNIIHQNPFNQIKTVMVKTLMHNIPKMEDEIKEHILFGGRSAIACYLQTTI